MRSSKVSSLCSQCSDRKYSFSSSATSWFRTPNFRRSKATDEDAGKAAYRRSNSFQRFDRTDLVYRRIAVHRRIDYHESAYQIPAFNTTDWYTGESAYTGESITIIRRIRFKRITQQIGTPAKRRTSDRRVAVSDSNVQHNRLVHRRGGDRRVAVSDSNVQHNRLVQRQSGVPATGESPYQIPTSNTTDWYTGEAAYRRPATGDRRPATGESPYQLPT